MSHPTETRNILFVVAGVPFTNSRSSRLFIAPKLLITTRTQRKYRNVHESYLFLLVERH